MKRIALAAAGALLCLWGFSSPALSQARPSTCYACHGPIQQFHVGSKHAKVACSSCHEGLERHLLDARARPATLTDPRVCGKCHKLQYESFATTNWMRPARSEKSLATGASPNPAWEKLMSPHGFTKEHSLPRSHAFMLIDHYVVDRAYGGRFVPKSGWRYLALSGAVKAWDVLEDRHPGEEHKAFKPGTAAAANPVCLSCKTADHILDWAYLGEASPGAKWNRGSKVAEMAKELNHALNCFFCHDPHSARPRIVRDGLIQALTRPEKDTLWHKDPRATPIEVKDLGLRGFTRKIAVLGSYDTKLQCGQCHVEYNCNPGNDTASGKPITMADARTNHFPLKDVTAIAQHYIDLQFRDFRHGITGALLWKSQHPDVETYWNSKHDKAGVQCHDCHMPKVKDPKTGKRYTSHWQTNPRNYLKETCLKCHGEWTETQARYVIESLSGHLQGKTRKAEFWLTRFIDRFDEASIAGIEESALKAARDKHFEAHVHWEWWTSTNGAAIHNPDQAKESINRSMALSQDGLRILEEAMRAKRATAAR